PARWLRRACMPDRLERLATLAANLLDTRIPLTLDDIAERVPGYPPDRASFKRQFERDKATLREIGVPVNVETLDHLGGEVGYRIRPEEYALPPLHLTPDETAALHIAVHAIAIEGDDARAALWKLGGTTQTGIAPVGLIPSFPALATLFDAYRARAAATFTYRGEERILDPYGLVFARGHWYVAGFDHDREAIRSFRVDRIDGEVQIGPPDTVERPADLDVCALVTNNPAQFADGDAIAVDLLVDAPHVDEARRRYPDATVTPHPNGAVVTVPVTSVDAFLGSVLAFLDGVTVLGPDTVRAAIITHLEDCAQGFA
ncbi:MAG: helix-turn-helix transcriptional regulator, partial [Acidimicrobiia bacterium]